MITKIYSILLTGLLFLSFEASAKRFKSGPWLFELHTNNATVPFIVHFRWKGKKLLGELDNGLEKIALHDITVKDDQIIIPIQTYEITMELSKQNDKIYSGYLIRHNKNPIVKTAVKATQGVKHRFPSNRIKPEKDYTGRYRVEILDEDGAKSQGVLVLKQKESALTGSLLTPTGDYRYFEGFVSGNEISGVSFDGMFNYRINGTVKENVFEGSLLSNYKLKISGKLDPKADLPDAYAQTQLEKLDFAFPDLNGKMISLQGKQFAGRPVIVQFFGSWCPNCIDEMNYLIPWYKQNHKRGIDIIALAFERSLDQELAKTQLRKIQKVKQIPYTLLIAGSTAEEKPKDRIPGIKNFISFPTTIFLNKKHEVVKVHAGFTGPGTGEFFEKWKKEFNQTVDGLLK